MQKSNSYFFLCSKKFEPFFICQYCEQQFKNFTDFSPFFQNEFHLSIENYCKREDDKIETKK